MNNVPDLSICIVTYQARDFLKDCLESLYRNTQQVSYEVIVVDNHSEDGVEEMLRQEFPQVCLTVAETNEGYTRPMNRALRRGRGRYLVQLNPDTLVMPGAFDELVQFMDAHPQAGICTPKVLNRDGTLQKQCRRSAARPWDTISYFSGLATRFPKSRRLAGYLVTYLDEDEINEVEAVSGSCMVIRRELVEHIGYLDELFFAYQEDADFCFRARKAGWKVVYVPRAQIIHFGGLGGSAVEVYRSIYQWHRSYFLYYRKHLASDYFFLFNWLLYLLMGIKLLLALASTALRKQKYAGTRKP
jgi:GT2 family glycosyltransferase